MKTLTLVNSKGGARKATSPFTRLRKTTARTQEIGRESS